MKRFAVISLCLLITALSHLRAPLFTPACPAYGAASSYARANVRTAYFFTEKNTSASLFAVPYTYCVEVLREEGEWYYVRYASDTGVYKALYGYCRKDDFTLESTTPAVTYLYKTVPISYSVSGGVSSLPVLGEITLEGAYYGVYYAGATVYSYVYCQGSFGYIEGANDDYPLNLPDDNDGKQDNPDVETGGGTKVSAGLIAFFVISFLLIVVLLVVFFTARRPRAE